MKKQYFVLMEHDHTLPKNKLQEEFRKRVKEDFNQTLITDMGELITCVNKIANNLNEVHSRSKPLLGYFSQESKYVNQPDCYRVDGLFKLSFYEVKEVAYV